MLHVNTRPPLAYVIIGGTPHVSHSSLTTSERVENTDRHEEMPCLNKLLSSHDPPA